jgi:thioredoxin 2
MALSTVRCPSCGKLNRVAGAASGVPRCGSCHTQLPWIVDATRDTFDDAIHATVPVLVDFWAPWCAPCRVVSPVVERVGRELAGPLKVVKLDIDGAPDIAARYGIQSIPLPVLLRDRAEVDRLVGAAPEARVRQWLEPHLAAAAGAQSA